jgi:glycosyltransferase involved in cell wall biosynthesis
VKYFAKGKNEIHWISLAPLTEGGGVGKIRFEQIQRRGIRTFSIVKAALQVRGLVRKIKPEIVHAHYAGTYGLIGALTGFHPLVVTAWGSDVLISGKSLIKGPVVRYVLKRADLITCDADHMAKAMARLGVRVEKINIVYFGIDIERFVPVKRSEDLTRRLGIFGSPVIISLRNLEPVYDVETLIRSIPLVSREIPNAKFVIVGGGSEEARLKDLSDSLGVSESVRFVGRIGNEHILEYLGVADIYVSTSLSDAGIAASTAEAMACSLPVVITDSGENRKWIKNGEGGFVIPVKDWKVLADKITVLLRRKDIRMRCGEMNRTVIEERNNYQKEMEKMNRIYEQLIENYHG